MTKLLVAFMLSAAFGAVFAQKVFKPIHFSSYQETTWKPLEFNSEVSHPSARVSGTIEINTNDSLITVSPDGQAPIKYKIYRVDAEEEDARVGEKTIRFLCKDSEGRACDAKITRKKDGVLKYTKVAFIYNGYLIAYFTDYIKNLYL